MTPVTSVFALPDRLAAKADPALIGGDEQHLAAVARCLRETVADLTRRLDVARTAPGGSGQHALDRDQEVHRLTARLRTLTRFGADLCLGHVVRADDPEPLYVGRLGLTDRTGNQLLVDWRTPAAEPFFGATHARPRGLLRRRRYRWSRGHVVDYWDEVFTPDGLTSSAALDDRSAFLASLGASRTAQMRDVLGTLAADQDAIIRAGSAGTLVVEGGPGTGKTVVALHRAASLLHRDPGLERRGGVLVVGPHEPYLAYVEDVLPSLGEEGVRTATLVDLVTEGATAVPETDPEVARLKASVAMVRAVEPAVRFHEEPPTTGTVVETPWAQVWLSPDDWATAFAAPGPGTPHDEAREEVWDELVAILVDRHDDDVPEQLLRRAVRGDRELVAVLHRAWPLVEAADLVADLWSVPAYLRRCAPWLRDDEVDLLQRNDPHAWTTSDLPLLDAARRRLGDPDEAVRQRRRAAAVAAQRAQMTSVVEELIAADDSELLLMTSLRQPDLRDALVDESGLPTAAVDRFAGPFAHVVVDEAQELTDAQWQVLLARCPSRSFTIVGDRAQARHGFSESWQERLQRIGLGRVTVATLTTSYRTPQEVMVEAEPVIRAVLPDADVPTSIRTTGVPVVHGSTADLGAVVDRWLAEHEEGIACVLGDPTFAPRPRVRSLGPELAKGLEFDLVVLVDPEAFGQGITGGVDRYVAMTRVTRQLVVLTSP